MRRLGLMIWLSALGCDTKVPIATTPVSTAVSTPTASCPDADSDGVCDDEDPCFGSQFLGDADGDGICNDEDPDDDNDGCDDEVDAAPQAASPDTDGDGVADDCDPCPADPLDDSDGDTVCDSDDLCPGFDDLLDSDSDGVADGCDPCPADPLDDSDGDTICDSDDACPGFPDDVDGDLDGQPDACDPCPLDPLDDSDGDGICDGVDICPAGDDNLDSDLDGVADACDPCPWDNPDDTDGDGYDVGSGDCNDCEPLIGPAAFEIPDSYIDENCDGNVDEARQICDLGLFAGETDPYRATAALDLCDLFAASGHGVFAADYVRANGVIASASGQTGLLDGFGNVLVPQHGDSMLVLSSGAARDLTFPGNCGTDSCSFGGPGTAPPGFPQNVPGCTGGNLINDDIGLEVELVAPINATGFRLKFYFLSFEFPEYVCTDFNDQFVILMDPAPVGAINGNIAFDSNTNPVSVNVAYLPVCNPASAGVFATYCVGGCPSLPNPYCADGAGDLTNTGFAEWQTYAGATGWLEVTAPVTPGASFTLRFAIWDTGDALLDSTVLIDDFEWVAEPVDVGIQPGN
jgi:hypothetical protein